MIKFFKEYLNEDNSLSSDSNEIDIESFDDENEDMEKLTLSNKFKNRLKELRIKKDNKLEVGDKILLVDNNKGKLSEDVFNFIKNKKVLEVKRINKNGKLDLGYYKYYTRKADGKKVKKIFYFSPNRFKKIDEFNIISQLFLSLENIEKYKLVEDPLDYFDVDDKGNITFIPRKNLKNVTGDPFDSKRRQTTRIGRMLKRIFTKDYLDKKINQKDIEIFTNKWNVLFDDSYHVEVLEGDDILRAYDCNEIGGGWEESSCANFSGKPNLDKFKVYTENTENIKCLTVFYKGKVYGRRMMFVGIQSKTHGKFKKGEEYTYLNDMYGEGGRGSKTDQHLKRWAKDNNAFTRDTLVRDDIFRIKIKKTCYKQYPPWDSMYVNFELDEIASRNPETEKGWKSAYGARCKK